MKPVMVDILNSSNETVGKVTFTEVDMNPTFADNYFDVEANMVKARENLSNRKCWIRILRFTTFADKWQNIVQS